MKVGDLIRSKNDLHFKEMGYAIITYHDGGNVAFVWIRDKSEHRMRWFELEGWMVLA
jgi:hypothetical protein|tara:strand:+ start:256 stop:426 length:171 start_codon:yes stop_codon:yes gene_type:complete